jgi:hypothetical protein
MNLRLRPEMLRKGSGEACRQGVLEMPRRAKDVVVVAVELPELLREAPTGTATLDLREFP